MKWRSRLAFWLIKSTYANPQAWFLDWITGGQESAAGVKVGPESSQRSAVVFACVQVRSQDIAKLPLILYRRREDGGRERAHDHPLFDLIANRPNSHQTSFEFREMMQANLDLRGNAYAKIVRDARMRPIELIPLHDDWVTPMMSEDGTPFYDVRMYGRGEKKRFPATDILHLKDRSDDGFVGKSCISRAKDVIGLNLAYSTHASKLFANGARPGGILSTAGKVGKEGRDLIKKEFIDEFGGVENAYKTMVGAESLKYEPIGMTNVDAELINGARLSRSEVASLFRMPPHKVGIMDNATFTNIEHQALEYVSDTLMPIARRWEQSLGQALLKESERATYYFEFLFDALLRGDFLSRMQGYAIGRQWGLYSVDDCMDMENRNHVPGGDERLVPLNMWPMGEPRPEKTLDAQPPGKAYEVYDAKVVHLPAQRSEHA